MTISGNPALPSSLGASVEGLECGTLEHILDHGLNMATWRRSPVPELCQELTHLDREWAVTIRLNTAVTNVDVTLTRALCSAGLNAAALARWIADMSGLVGVFAGIAGKSSLQPRLEAMDDTMCPRFHVDRNDLRLLCAYRGPATQWLTNSQVDRQALASGRPNEDVMRVGPAQRLEPFWVGIMKGNRFPGNNGSGLVHRSPPVENLAETRILFCLDA
ncbi:DUF1826 domain-containing protein [Aquisalimonas sp.]|uniref:DUF1826 domain-containing protein n=1 Tax=Aquisalimonas sp. TaxID=1872621 RepID=UPI0025BF901A|nr:DUF1826 domain-containing protein [Aquisalimonas sp.]